MATPSEIFTEMVTTTDRTWGRRITDNVSEHNLLLTRMKQRGNIKTVNGGYEIAEPVEYAENSTYQRYSGYEALNTQASDVLTTVKYPYQQVALHVTASGREVRMNNGEQAMKNLVRQRKRNAERSAANQFSIDMYSDGSLPHQVNGLANLVQTNGQGTVGGIDASSWTFWRNKFREMTGTDLASSPSVANAASLVNDMNQLWLATVRGTDKPDCIVATHDLYTLYEMSLQDKQRYTSADRASTGFGSEIRFKTADVVFDDNTNFGTSAEKMYFLNSTYLYLVQHREAQWTMESQKVPTNQDAIIVPMYWMGNMCCTNRSLQGVLFDNA